MVDRRVSSGIFSFKTRGTAHRYSRKERDRERSQMEGRIAAQMERSNTLIEGMKTLMESVVTSNEVLHADLAHSQARSQGMAEKVDHICDRVDLIYSRASDR